MKSPCLLIALFLGSILGMTREASATEPYETLSTTTPSGSYRVERQPIWDKAVTIYDSTDQPLHTLPITNVLQCGPWTAAYGEDYEISTAGIDWHLRSIAFIMTNETTFIMRHRSGHYIVIDLPTGEVRPIAEEEKEAADAQIRTAALSLLYATDSGDRQTGAIHCGQLGVTQAVSRLQELLADKAFYTVSGGTYAEPMAVLYVRQAAAQALSALGHNIKAIRYEFPEKDVLRWDESISRYVVDLPEEENIGTSVDGADVREAPSPEP